MYNYDSEPLAVPIAVAMWGLGYLLLRNSRSAERSRRSPRAVLFMAVLMVPVFWLLGNFGHASPEAVALGIGGVGVIFVRHLTELRLYDQRAGARGFIPALREQSPSGAGFLARRASLFQPGGSPLGNATQILAALNESPVGIFPAGLYFCSPRRDSKLVRIGT